MTKYLLKISSIFSKAKEKYGVAVYILFPAIAGYKLTKKALVFIRDAVECGKYLFLENKKYNIDYLMKITGIGNEEEFRETIKKKNNLLMGCINKDGFEFYNKHFDKERRKKINHAEMICEHVFDLMGSGPQKVNRKENESEFIDWQMDITSGYSWNAKTFRKWIDYGQVEGADIIVPWELSRFQDRMALAQAFKLTGNEKYVVEFQKQVNDWIENNRFGFGVNWMCTMDIAMRAANWLIIKELFETDMNFKESFLIKLYGSVYDHGRYVRNHLQRINNVTTNHYVSGIAGLLFIAVYCPFYRESNEWRDYAVQELETEIDRQVYADGCDYEASTSYHILVLEIFFYSMLLGERAGIAFSDSYKAKVKMMFEASLYFIKSDGHVPQIGDNDNGRLLKLSKKHVNDHKYLLSLAAIYYKDKNFKIKQFALDEEAFWIFGKNAEKVWCDLPYREQIVGSKAFEDAGWYIIRHNNDYCFISCGSNGQGGRGGHAHNDKLSFELMIDGKDIIVDPGTYAYTSYPKERNMFRATAYHNILKFKGLEQNHISEQALHFLPDSVEIAAAGLEKKDKETRFTGKIRYADVDHERSIVFNSMTGGWTITDKYVCNKELPAQLIYHLSPDVYYEQGMIRSKSNGMNIASINVRDFELRKSEYYYSPEYGSKVKAECLVLDIPYNNGARIVTEINDAGSCERVC